MSMDSCQKCGSPVDTDFDDEFYDEQGNGACVRCREDEQEEIL